MSERPGPPDDIKNSIKSGNIEHLRNAGKKGAEKTNRIKDIKRTITELETEEKKLKRLDEEYERQLSTNEHILTPDGEDTGWTPDDEPFISGDHYIIGGRH